LNPRQGAVNPNPWRVSAALPAGTEYDVDPVTAAHNLATAIRWLDYNDAWLASEWVHPSVGGGAGSPAQGVGSRV